MGSAPHHERGPRRGRQGQKKERLRARDDRYRGAAGRAALERRVGSRGGDTRG